MGQYDQPNKNTVRLRILRTAVEALTADRLNSPVVSAEYFDKLLNYCCRFVAKHGGQDIRPILEEPAELWRDLHRARVGHRKAIDLNVLMLCGPSPLADFKALIDLGVPPQNVWAVEGNDAAYRSALAELETANLPVRIHKGTLSEFFDVIPQQFDVIYLDACGPLFGGTPRTIDVLRELFVNQRLAPLSALITNFSEANADGKHAGEWARRLAAWYSPRHQLPCDSTMENTQRIEEFDVFCTDVESHLSEYYSDFVSRFTIEFAGLLLPWWRVIALPAARREYFTSSKTLAARVDASLDVPKKPKASDVAQRFACAEIVPDAYPYLWTSILAKTLKHDDPLRRLFYVDAIRGQNLVDAVKVASLIRNFFDGRAEWGEQQLACSKGLARILDNFKWFDSDGEPWHRMFCDTPFPRLVVDLLLGSYGYPYHVNVNKLTRLKYTAKTIPMYTDVFVMDQARYLYDFVPCMPTFEGPLGDAHQFILRICMDSIGKHAYFGYRDLFRGCALAGIGEEDFTVSDWPGRKIVASG